MNVSARAYIHFLLYKAQAPAFSAGALLYCQKKGAEIGKVIMALPIT